MTERSPGTGAVEDPAGGLPTLQVDLATVVDPATGRPALPWDSLEEHVQEWRAAELLDRFFFVRKPPGLRLRFQGRYLAELEPELCAWIAGLEHEARIRSGRFSVYEPERARFGGASGLSVAHRWFDHDAAAALRYERLSAENSVSLPRVLAALLLLDDLVRNVVGDDAERWECWSALEAMVAPLPTAGVVDAALLAACVHEPGVVVEACDAATRGLLEAGFSANEATATRVRAVAAVGRLGIGARAWLVAGVPFHWNRFGLPLEPAELRATVEATIRLLAPDHAGHRRG